MGFRKMPKRQLATDRGFWVLAEFERNGLYERTGAHADEAVARTRRYSPMLRQPALSC